MQREEASAYQFILCSIWKPGDSNFWVKICLALEESILQVEWLIATLINVDTIQNMQRCRMMKLWMRMRSSTYPSTPSHLMLYPLRVHHSRFQKSKNFLNVTGEPLSRFQTSKMALLTNTAIKECAWSYSKTYDRTRSKNKFESVSSSAIKKTLSKRLFSSRAGIF